MCSKSFLSVFRRQLGSAVDFRETTRFDISYWGLTEKALVLTVELTGAFVADFKSDTGRIDSLNQHSLACGYQSKLFLILKRAHRSQGTEVVVQC